MKKIVYFLSTVLLLLFSMSFGCNGQVKDIVEGPAKTVLPADVYASLMTKYKSIDNFHQGRAIVVDSKGKFGMIDNRGNMLIDCLYELIYDLSDTCGLLWVKMNGAWGLYNSEYKMIARCLYDFFRFPRDGVITLSINKHSVYGAIDANDGSIVIPFKYEELGEYSEGLFAAKKSIDGKSVYGYIDRNNATVIPFIYSNASNFSEGLAAVEMETAETLQTRWGPIPVSVCGFINKKGETAIPFIFQGQSGSTEFHEGLCAIRVSEKVNPFIDDKNVFVNSKGEVVISGLFDDAENFYNGVALIKKSEKYGYINRNGEIIIPCVYDECGYGNNDLCLIKDGEEYHFTYQGDFIKGE